MAKPQAYMNRSGQALTALAAYPEFLPSEDLLVVVDDAALEVGRVRFRAQGSPGGHNGLRSVTQALGSEEYPRLRIGVGRPEGGGDVIQHVLEPFRKDEQERLDAMLEHAVQAHQPPLVRGGQGRARVCETVHVKTHHHR